MRAIVPILFHCFKSAGSLPGRVGAVEAPVHQGEGAVPSQGPRPGSRSPPLPPELAVVAPSVADPVGSSLVLLRTSSMDIDLQACLEVGTDNSEKRNTSNVSHSLHDRVVAAVFCSMHAAARRVSAGYKSN